MTRKPEPRDPLLPPLKPATTAPAADDWDDDVDDIDLAMADSRSGCAWFLLGALGCLTLPLVALLVVIIMGLNTVGGVLDGVRSIFDPPPPVYNFYSPALVLDRVQSLSQLTVTRYNFSNVVHTEREMPYVLSALYRDRLAMVIVGHVNAGIDLSLMTEADIRSDGETLTLRLPAPALQDCFLNERGSYVISRETGLFTSGAPQLDLEARRFAVHEFREAALEDGILERVNEQAQATLTGFLNAFAPADGQPIRIVTTPPDPLAAHPASCR